MKKIGLITLILIVALGAMGVGYAAWTQTLVINGTAQTGILDVIFENPQNVPPVPDPGVAWVIVTPPYDEAHKFDVTVGNAYPGLVVEVSFDVHNEGTIPAGVNAPTIVCSDEVNYTVECAEVWDGIPYFPFGPQWMDLNAVTQGLLRITIGEDAPQTDTMLFTVTFDARQLYPMGD